MDKLNKNFKIIKEKILEKYDFLFVLNKLTGEFDCSIGKKCIEFYDIFIFCAFEEEIYKGIPNIEICIKRIDPKLTEFLKSKKIDFELRQDEFYEDTCIEELQYGEESTQLILNLIDFFYKNYLQG